LENYRKQLESRREAEQGKMPWYALHWPRYRELYTSPKVMCRQTSDTLIATVDPYDHCALNSTIILRPDADEWSPFFWAALLNSRLLKYVYSLLAQEEDRVFAEVKPVNLRKLPIRRIAFTTPIEERARRAAEAGRLTESWLTGGQPLTRAAYAASSPASLVAARLAAGQSDVVHDLLAALAEQMIAMHTEKQGTLRAFRLDLAGYLDERQLSKLNRLYTPKKPPSESDKNYPAKLATYQQAADLARAQLGELAGQTLGLDDFWQVNQAQWVWLLRQNLGQVAAMSGLVTVYERYHARLAPLMRRIRRTDWLIDQVVYRLYGLTEEEIGVVEGRPSAG
jgi:hypothetical protein